MKSIHFSKFGNPLNVLELKETVVPEPKNNEIRLKMIFCPINPSDLYLISGEYGFKPELPCVPGFEGLGKIDAIGTNIEAYKVGQRAIPISYMGTWSEYIILKPAQLMLVPPEIPDRSASQLLVNPLAAWILIQNLKLKKGEFLLQTAAGSTLGRIILQITQFLGIKTINFVRREEQIKELEKLGADYVFCTKDEDLIEKVIKITEKGVHGAIDAVGGKTGAIAASCLRSGKILYIYGLLSMEDTPINTGEMIFKETKIIGFWLNRWFRNTNSKEIFKQFSDLMKLIVQGVIIPPVEAEYNLVEFKDAIKHSMKRGRKGKILLKGI